MIAGGDVGHPFALVADCGGGELQLLVGQPSGTAESLAVLACGGHSGAGAFADDGPLELGKRRHHVENESPAGTTRVDVFGEGIKMDAAFSEIFHQLHQLNQ